jgi:dCMP deaminase
MKKITDGAGNASDHCLRTIHAEQNAIAQAARHGISLEGATLYCRMEPCRRCAMLIMASGVKRVVCEKRYHSGQETREMFSAGGITLEVIEDVVLGYE